MKHIEFQKRQLVAERLLGDPAYCKWALLGLFERQTPSEQNLGETLFRNNVGFNAADAKALSRSAEWLRQGGQLTTVEHSALAFKLIKYWRQILAMGRPLLDSSPAGFSHISSNPRKAA